MADENIFSNFLGARFKTDDAGTVVVFYQNERLFSGQIDLTNMADLASDGQAVQGNGGYGVVSLVEQDGAEICVISSHLDIVVIIVPEQKDIREAVAICIDDNRVAERG